MNKISHTHNRIRTNPGGHHGNRLDRKDPEVDGIAVTSSLNELSANTTYYIRVVQDNYYADDYDIRYMVKVGVPEAAMGHIRRQETCLKPEGLLMCWRGSLSRLQSG